MNWWTERSKGYEGGLHPKILSQAVAEPSLSRRNVIIHSMGWFVKESIGVVRSKCGVACNEVR